MIQILTLAAQRNLQELCALPSTMDATTFLASDRDLLVRMVKDCQKSKVIGTQGSWKDFLKAQTPALSKNDPSMHSWKVCKTSHAPESTHRPYAASWVCPADACCFRSHLEQATGWYAYWSTQGI